MNKHTLITFQHDTVHKKIFPGKKLLENVTEQAWSNHKTEALLIKHCNPVINKQLKNNSCAKIMF